MNDSPFLPILGCLCIYPFVCFAIPAFLIGRYRIKLRSPLKMEDRRPGEYARARTVEKTRP